MHLRGPTGDAAAPRGIHRLLAGGGLDLAADPALTPSLARWLPRFGDEARTTAPRPRIHVSAASSPLPTPPRAEPTLQLGPATVWLDESTRTAQLRTTDPLAGGHADLSRGEAWLQAPTPGAGPADPALELFTLLTLSSALLLAGDGRALVHAAAIVRPTGRAWLLIGDTHSGKTTTTVNLLCGGNRFLSDDHVVVQRDPAGTGAIAEGWPRIFHIDEGWGRGEITGRRVDFDPTSLGPDRWLRSAPIGGLLFPRIDADRPTRAEPIPPATALARLIRQSPWFIADRAAAPAVLGLLQTTAALPAFDLRLGRDSYADAERLQCALRPLDEQDESSSRAPRSGAPRPATTNRATGSEG